MALRRVLLAICLILGIGLAPAQAADFERINMYEVEVYVTSTGDFEITETITYNFGGNYRHGILRDIPLRDELPNGQEQPYEIEILEVLADLDAVQYEATEVDGNYLEIRIGDPDATITGSHEYQIKYILRNGLTLVTEEDTALDGRLQAGDVSFYWDVIGSEWTVPIMGAFVVVVLPGEAIAVNCTFGAIGSTEQCAMHNDFATSFTLPGEVPLQPGEAMTVSIQLSPSMFSVPVEPYLQSPWSDRFAGALPYAGVTALLAGLATGLLVWRLRRRVQSFPVPEFVRFEPPSGLRPTEMAVSWHGKLDSRGFTAALLDLAARGAIGLKLQDDNLVISSRDLNVEMADWERQLIAAILAGGQETVLDGYRKEIGAATGVVGQDLLDAAVATGRYNRKAWRGRWPVIALTVSAVAVFMLSMALMDWPQVFAVVVLTAPVVALIAAVGIKLVPLQQTESSAAFLSEVLGFRKAMDTDAAAARREFAHRSGLTAGAIFATMLPFAVVYELEESWTGAFPDITPAELAAYGISVVSMHDMNSVMRATEHSLASAMTSPSRSGSGGGGGSSGGGGGGGGGGSW